MKNLTSPVVKLFCTVEDKIIYTFYTSDSSDGYGHPLCPRLMTRVTGSTLWKQLHTFTPSIKKPQHKNRKKEAARTCVEWIIVVPWNLVKNGPLTLLWWSVSKVTSHNLGPFILRKQKRFSFRNGWLPIFNRNESEWFSARYSYPFTDFIF